MSKPLSQLSINLLGFVSRNSRSAFHEIYKAHIQKEAKKSVYDALFRLEKSGYLSNTIEGYLLTKKGQELIHRKLPLKDGVWKIVIFDIPETKRRARGVLRAKLISLGFKKWQNSTWISPYQLSPQIEEELNLLAKKFFIRLIKTTSINYTKDLDKLFSK